MCLYIIVTCGDRNEDYGERDGESRIKKNNRKRVYASVTAAKADSEVNLVKCASLANFAYLRKTVPSPLSR